MRRATVLWVWWVLSIALPAHAGTLMNGGWSPTGCGDKPAPAALDLSSTDAYNRSVKAVNAWQEQAQNRLDCLIKEANADNAAIAKTANDEKAQFRAAIDKINADAQTAKTKLEGK